MKLSTASVFNDHMVLQREKRIKIWGESDPNSEVTICIQNRTCSVKTDEKGKWSTSLPELKASVNETLEIRSGEEKLVYSDVLVGEVWLAGGQSNMELKMFYDADYASALSECENPMIRFYEVPQIASEEHVKRNDYSLYGFWRPAEKENLKYFSAVAYYFARALQEDLQVPVGIVGCCWGGSRSCCWMDRETLEECGPVWIEDYERGLEQITDPEKCMEEYFSNPMMDSAQPFNEIRNRLMKGVSPDELQEILAGMGEGCFAIGPWNEWRPNALYEWMLKTIIPFTFRGVIYYQGESDEDHPEIYADMLEAQIKLWRREFGEELPFIMTQLVPLGEVIGQGGKYFPALREQQEMAARRLANVWFASTGDAGDYEDIHPKRKYPVGKRLALLARGHVYGEAVLCDAPEGTEMFREGDDLVIECSGAEGGLYVAGEEVNALEITDDAGRNVPKTEYEVLVSAEQIRICFMAPLSGNPYTVRFAKTPYYEVNLYNMAGIPMKPFEVTETR